MSLRAAFPAVSHAASHAIFRAAFRAAILLGGSVLCLAAHTTDAQPDIDGALVGGASLDAAGFARIIQAAG